MAIRPTRNATRIWPGSCLPSRHPACSFCTEVVPAAATSQLGTLCHPSAPSREAASLRTPLCSPHPGRAALKTLSPTHPGGAAGWSCRASCFGTLGRLAREELGQGLGRPEGKLPAPAPAPGPGGSLRSSLLSAGRLCCPEHSSPSAGRPSLDCAARKTPPHCLPALPLPALPAPSPSAPRCFSCPCADGPEERQAQPLHSPGASGAGFVRAGIPPRFFTLTGLMGNPCSLSSQGGLVHLVCLLPAESPAPAHVRFPPFPGHIGAPGSCPGSGCSPPLRTA